MAYSTINRAFSVQHACGLSTTPTLLACTDVTVHAQAQCMCIGKGRKVIVTKSVITLCYSGYRACGLCALESSIYELNSLCTCFVIET